MANSSSHPRPRWEVEPEPTAIPETYERAYRISRNGLGVALARDLETASFIVYACNKQENGGQHG